MPALLVNEPLLRRIFENPVLRQIGCLQTMEKQLVLKKGCGSCGRNKVIRTTQLPMEAAKLCLYRMPEDQLQQIKQQLNADRLIFYFRAAGLPPRAIR